jgi:4-diphosphocytidyl-2-C-methyl-D-erythritol kinase
VNKTIIKSFGKVNLNLRVIKKLKENYHTISSLITYCGIYDIISIEKKINFYDSIIFSGKFKKGINKKKNTITKLLYLLRSKGFFKNIFFKIHIQKNIPHGSGLGGGSSNAASLLNFFNKKMKLKLKKSFLYKLASKIGFDVPIIMEKKNTFLMGKKINIKRINRSFKLNILLVYPNIKCSTKKIYKSNKNFSFFKPHHSFNKIKKIDLIDYLIRENNDLEDAAVKLYPKIGEIIRFIKIQNGCYLSRITGSGSVCIGIFSNNSKATYAKNLIKLKFPKYWCVVSRTI